MSTTTPIRAQNAQPSRADLLRLLWAHLEDSTANRKNKLLLALDGRPELLLDGEQSLRALPLSAAAKQQVRQWRRWLSVPAEAAEGTGVAESDRLSPAMRADWQWLSDPHRPRDRQRLQLLPSDAAYPETLRRLTVAPLPLYLEGDPQVLQPPLLALVGSRSPSPGGRETAYRLAAELAGLGFGIVSGLATGIDAAAHRGALDNSGRTLAVVATGADRVYPNDNRQLAADILKEGAILTEYAIGTSVRRHQFPARNRIIGALAQAVLLVEAGAKSGALSTASTALELGVEVMAVPGAVPGGKNAGCHRLIREGAALVENSLQVLECLDWLPQRELQLQLQQEPGSRQPPGLSAEQAQVWQQLSLQPLPADVLSERLHWPVAQVASVLAELEIAGAAYREAGGYIRAG